MSEPIDLLSAARDLYEGTHGMSMNELTEITGIAKRTLVQRARDQDWRKHQSTKTGESTDEALAAAEIFKNYTEKSTELVEETNSSVQILSQPLPTERDELLARHKQEWIAPRAMSAEAVNMRNIDPYKAMERAKIAKITAETLKIMQESERKAHGLDVGVDVPPGHVVVIERA